MSASSTTPTRETRKKTQPVLMPPPPPPLHGSHRRRNSPNTISEWRSETRAAKSAGQLPTGILTSFFHCHICSICIGRGYVETELYLWPVEGVRLCLVDKYCELDRFTVLHLCGSCARRRQLPETLLAVSPIHYMTRLLLDEDGLGEGRPLGIQNEKDNLALRLALGQHIATFKARLRTQHLLQGPTAKAGRVLPFKRAS